MCKKFNDFQDFKTSSGGDQTIVIYVDLLFLENLMMDSLLLLLVSLFLRQPTTCPKLLLASAAGSAYCCFHTVFILWLKGSYPSVFHGFPGMLRSIVTTVISYLFLCILMLYLAFGIRDKHSLMKNTAVFYAAAVFTGGVFQSAMNLLTPHNHLSWGAIVLFALFTFAAGLGIIRAWHHKNENGDLYDIFLEFGNNSVHTKALLDTGNRLYEPLEHRPVTIVEKTVLGGIELQKYENTLRAVPFQSLGNAHGMLYAVTADRIIIRCAKKVWQYPEALIGIYPGSLQKSGNYHGILHPDMISCGQCLPF